VARSGLSILETIFSRDFFHAVLSKRLAPSDRGTTDDANDDERSASSEGFFARWKIRLGFWRGFAEKMERKTLRVASRCGKVRGLFSWRDKVFGLTGLAISRSKHGLP
jgi:hypothetical protein